MFLFITLIFSLRICLAKEDLKTVRLPKSTRGSSLYDLISIVITTPLTLYCPSLTGVIGQQDTSLVHGTNRKSYIETSTGLSRS